MKLSAALVAVALAGVSALPAAAQAPADPIGDILRQRASAIDPEEPDTAAAGSKVQDEPSLPAPPRPYVPSTRPALTTPVRIEETGKAPDGPPTAADLAYDSRIRSAMASAQAFQGPMAGAWTLTGGGRELYALQLNDKNGVVDGAWRDLRRAGALDGSGFIDAVERTEGGVVVRIGERVVTLHPDTGGWTGELAESGHSEAVSLRRRNP